MKTSGEKEGIKIRRKITGRRHGQRWRESEDAGRGRSSCLYKKVQACGGQRVRDVTAVFVQHVHSAVLAGRLACV